ncbi:MAG: hypothetical protein CBB97_09505 [Candidatus Endolissoclinum sp. TMED37]|nr:MAG: hypothetical protein CBB97_09505 [Candidatus Endolissoclinum sp. TMED37]
MKNFKWKTKGQTLLWLQKKVTKSQVPSLMIFTHEKWLKNKRKILHSIRKKFLSKKIAIRSSSYDEDSIFSSNAGAFESYLNIDIGDSKLLTKTINKVFASYKKNKNTMDEVIIQEMVSEISMSGVIFTHEIKNGAPYYSINYDDVSGSSTTVTSGSSRHSNKTLYIHRKSLRSVGSDRFLSLLKSILELEKIFLSNKLDIEFIVTNSLEIKILQVRLITSLKNLDLKQNKLITKEISNLQKNLKNKVFSLNDIISPIPVFGQMPDWNPVEMLGVVPRNLDFSLYKTLITDSVWCLAREQMNYAKSKNRSLMYNFAGHPYINVKSSFSSFIPKTLNKKIAIKLVNYWLERLRCYPELHDKIEFDIAITTYSFDLKDKIKQLPKEIFSEQEKIAIEKVYYEHFIKLMDSKSQGSLAKSKKEMQMLEAKIKELSKQKKITIKKLINLCKKYGTLPFSKLARHAFIGTTIIKSLHKIGVINSNKISNFSSSINTILSEMLFDVDKLKKNKLNEFDFKNKYGHLRPGTYNINSKCYRDIDPIDLFGDKVITQKEKIFNFSNSDLKKINDLLLKHKLPFKNANRLLTYIRESIQTREISKFQFTKVIDLIFESIKLLSKELSLSIEDLSFLTIETISSIEQKTNYNIRNKLIREIKKNKQQHKIFTCIKLPQLIMDHNHAVVIPFQVSAPNFITNKIIEAEIIYIKNLEKGIKLNNKIVLIESADPGYDWLFTTKFKGLITKYGGANSHMAIRCAELKLPAAIGTGEQLFESFRKYKKINLNCASSIIHPI